MVWHLVKYVITQLFWDDNYVIKYSHSFCLRYRDYHLLRMGCIGFMGTVCKLVHFFVSKSFLIMVS